MKHAVPVIRNYPADLIATQAVFGGQMWDVTVGVNWHLYPNLRLMTNYIHSQAWNRRCTESTCAGVSDPATPFVFGNGDIIQTRLQIDF